jgi:hypothetical protein
MTKAIIHVGMDKTGTTSLQERFSILRSRLIERGFMYPMPTGPVKTHHVAFAAAHGFSWNFTATPEGSRNAWSTMQDELPGHTHALLLSSEHFCYNATPKTVGLLKAWLTSNGFNQAEILVYVRSQLGWLVSAFGENIKWGGKEDFALFYRQSVPRLRYGLTSNVWADAFGANNVKLINYDRARSVNPEQGIVDAAWDAIGMSQAQREGLAVTEKILSNTLSSQVLLEWLRTRDVGLTQQQYQSYASRVLGNVRVMASQPLLDATIWSVPEAFKQDMATFSQENAALSSRFGMAPLADLKSDVAAYERKLTPLSPEGVTQSAMMILFEAASIK